MSLIGDYPNPYHRTVGFAMTNGKETRFQVVQFGDVLLTALGLHKQYRLLVMPESAAKRFSGYVASKFKDPLELALWDDEKLAQICVDYQNTLKEGTWKLT